MSLYEYLRCLHESLGVVAGRLEMTGAQPALDTLDAVEDCRARIGGILEKVPEPFAVEVQADQGYLW